VKKCQKTAGRGGGVTHTVYEGQVPETKLMIIMT